MIKIIDTNAIKSIITNAISELASNYEITTTTSARTSHGRTNSTSITTLTRKPAVKEEKVEKEEWVVQPKGWTPRVGHRADGLKELWGAPRVSGHGEITVPVKLVDGEITIREYYLALTTTVKGNIDTCRRMATAAMIEGRYVYLTSDIWRAARLLSYHVGEAEWEELRELVNELMIELNYISELTTTARKNARAQGKRQLLDAYGITEEEIDHMHGGLWKKNR